jgi:hypothetical protein
MWTLGLFDSDRFYSQKVLTHFRAKQLVDCSTYTTQISCLTRAIISKAHFNDKYNYAQDCEGLRPLQDI